MGRQEVVHSAWKRLQEAGLVICQDKLQLTGCELVVGRNKVRAKAVGNQEREVGVISATIGGNMQVSGGELGARYREGTWETELVHESGRDSRAV